MPVTSTFKVSSSYSNTVSSDASGTITDSPTAISVNTPFKSGTAAKQIDTVFRKVSTLANSASDTYTLSALPGSVAFARVRKLLVTVTSATGSVTVAPNTSAGWTNGVGGPVVVQSGGAAAQTGGVLAITWPAAAGAIVASGSNDQLKITASGGATYLLHLEGCSA